MPMSFDITALVIAVLMTGFLRKSNPLFWLGFFYIIITISEYVFMKYF